MSLSQKFSLIDNKKQIQQCCNSTVLCTSKLHFNLKWLYFYRWSIFYIPPSSNSHHTSIVPLPCFFRNCWLASRSFWSATLNGTMGCLGSKHHKQALMLFTTKLFITLYSEYDFSLAVWTKLWSFSWAVQDYTWSLPLCMRGLLCVLVTLDEGLEESLSESLLRLMDTTNSFIPGAFSWADISSSGDSRTM